MGATGGVTRELERGRDRDERLEARVRTLEQRLASLSAAVSVSQEAAKTDRARLRDCVKDLYEKHAQLVWRVALIGGALATAGSAAGGLIGGG